MWATMRSSLWWGRELQIQYFADVYPVTVEAVGYRPLYNPENVKLRS